ncbi:hypothetical protein ACJX0J_010332, partial [Zea mays]
TTLPQHYIKKIFIRLSFLLRESEKVKLVFTLLRFAPCQCPVRGKKAAKGLSWFHYSLGHFYITGGSILTAVWWWWWGGGGGGGGAVMNYCSIFDEKICYWRHIGFYFLKR